MTWRDWTATTPMRIALGVLAVALAALVWSLRGALQPAPVAAAQPAPELAPSALATPAPAPRVDVAAAVETDLFAVNRSAPPVRYRPPGEVISTGPSAPAEPPKPVVLGTAIAVDGSSFATCQFDSPKLLMVRVGDHVGNYVVKSIARDRVVFATPEGKSLEILAPHAGS